MAAPSARRATLEDLLARDDPDRLEVVDGELVERATPSIPHARSSTRLAAAFDPFNHRPSWRSDVVRAEPFEAIELDVGMLFGVEPDGT